MATVLLFGIYSRNVTALQPLPNPKEVLKLKKR